MKPFTPPSFVDRDTGQVMVWDSSSHDYVPAQKDEIDQVPRTWATGNDAPDMFDPSTDTERYHNGEAEFGTYSSADYSTDPQFRPGEPVTLPDGRQGRIYGEGRTNMTPTRDMHGNWWYYVQVDGMDGIQRYPEDQLSLVSPWPDTIPYDVQGAGMPGETPEQMDQMVHNASNTCPRCQTPTHGEENCMVCGQPLADLDVPRLHTQDSPFNDSVPKLDLNAYEPSLPGTALAHRKSPEHPRVTGVMDPIHLETIQRLSVGNFNVAGMEDCPSCDAPGMLERGDHKICPDCGHKQKIMYAAEKKAFDLGGVTDAIGKGIGDAAGYAGQAVQNPYVDAGLLAAGLAIPGVGWAADAGLLGAGAADAGVAGAEAAGLGGEAAGTAGEAAQIGQEAAQAGGVADQAATPGETAAGAGEGAPAPGRVRQLMNGAMGMGKNYAMMQGLNSIMNQYGGGGGQAQPDYSQMQTQLAHTGAHDRIPEGMGPGQALDEPGMGGLHAHCPECGWRGALGLAPVNWENRDWDDAHPGDELGMTNDPVADALFDSECPNCRRPLYQLNRTGRRHVADGEPDDNPDTSIQDLATKNDGDDVTDEKTQGAMEDHGDSLDEFLRDIADWGGANSYNGDQQDALSQFNDKLPKIIELNISDDSGHNHPDIKALDDLLKKVFPDLGDLGLPEMHHETEKQSRTATDLGAGPLGPGQPPMAPQTQEDGTTCATCGGPHPTAQHQQFAAGMPGMPGMPNMQMPAQPRQMMLNTPVSKKTAAGRRPKMCPYHADLVDYALQIGDPTSALQAVPGAYGPGHCKGGHEGTCNFKPAMVTQTFWDEREERLQAQREERERLMAPEQALDGDLSPVEEGPEVDMPFEVTDDSEGHHNDTSGGESAVGGQSFVGELAMAAHTAAGTDNHKPDCGCPFCAKKNESDHEPEDEGAFEDDTYNGERESSFQARIAMALAAYGQNASLAPDIARYVLAGDEDWNYGFGTPQTAQGQPKMGMDGDFDHDQFSQDVDMADNEGQCPMCGGPGVPLGQLGSQSHYRCRNCGADFSSPQHDMSPLGPGPSQGTTIARTVTAVLDPKQLQVDNTYLMHTKGYQIPDLVKVKAVKPNSVIVEFQNKTMNFPQEISFDDLDRDGVSFEPQGMAPEAEVMNAERGATPDTAPGPGEVTDLSDLPTSVSHDETEEADEGFDPGFEGSDAESGLLWDSLGQVAASTQVTAGKNFTRSEQSEFIREEGPARNLDKMSLEGTHYEEPPEFVMWLS